MPSRSLVLTALVAVTATTPPAAAVLAQTPAPAAVDVRLVTDEADAALAILDALARGQPLTDAAWRRLTATEGYRRLRQRELAIGRRLDDTTFQRYLRSPATLARTDSLRGALASWKRGDVTGAARRAAAYLPKGSTLSARLYPVIKPATNTFVFEPATDSAAIFFYLDPAIPQAKLENTLAHELHHIGYAQACRDQEAAEADPKVAAALRWVGAFGEGVAMLAAAGGVDAHPHAVSDSAERSRWERDYANVGRDLAAVEGFLTRILDGTLAGDAITAEGMKFFGDAQGAWYTVGYLMATTIERAEGREALIEVLCDRRGLLRAYDRAVGKAGSARWSAAFLSRIGV